MAQSKTERSVAKPAAARATTAQEKIANALANSSSHAKKQLAAQGQKLPTQNWAGSAIRNPAVGLKRGDKRASKDPFVALIGSGNRKYCTDQVIRMTRGDDWNRP